MEYDYSTPVSQAKFRCVPPPYRPDLDSPDSWEDSRRTVRDVTVGSRLSKCHIFTGRAKPRKYSEFLRITKGAVEFKSSFLSDAHVRWRRGRGKIVDFSKKSRKRCMIACMNLKEDAKGWITFTFADDVLRGKSVEDVARYSSDVLKLFKRRVAVEFPVLNGIWRREWKRRVHGDLSGLLEPHFHAILAGCGLSSDEFELVALRLLEVWIACTGTSELGKAFSVALHRNKEGKFDSFEYLNSAQKAVAYISKYMGKEDAECVRADESLGRMWGEIGRPEYEDSETWICQGVEQYLFKRTMRRLMKSRVRARKKKRPGQGAYLKRLSRRIDNGLTWLIVSRETTHRVIAWIECQAVPPF